MAAISLTQAAMIDEIALHRDERADLCRHFHVRRLAVRGRSGDLVEAGAVRNPYLKASIEQSRENVYAA